MSETNSISKKRIYESEIVQPAALPVTVLRKSSSIGKAARKSPPRQVVLRLIEWFKKE